jgi:hypothetical protein
MRLTHESIEEFRALWDQKFGQTITKEYATRGHEIVMFYEKLYLSGAGLSSEKEKGAPP